MIVVWLALLLGSVIWAEEQYFHQSNPATWDEARQYCQACFKDLTTLTCMNVHDLLQKLGNSDFWVGLRRNLNGSIIPWSRWSNGDPVSYQNWYPGHPVPKVETCPLTPNNTSVNSTTAPKANNTEEQCPLVMEILNCLNLTFGELERITGVNQTPHSLYSTPLPTVNITSNNTQTCDTKAEKYIEDSCLALLSFGMWKEKQCNESLPFICYDERFFGEINISNVTKSEGSVYWSQGPGNISHYTVKVTGGHESNETGMVKKLEKLTSGTLYKVQVYPVKCGRHLNPQNISFYTPPYDVYDLKETNVDTTSVDLSWNHSGNCDFYLITDEDKPDEPNKINTTQIKICNLVPGKEYTFTVAAVVNETTKSVSASVSFFTKPSRVLNLTSADNNCTVITANWKRPVGKHTSYRICLNETNNNKCENRCQLGNCNETSYENFTFTDKTPGMKYCLCVAALTNVNQLSGEMVTVEAYTRPEKVELLDLEPSSQHIFAHWAVNGTFEQFSVSIEAEGVKTEYNTSYKNYNFTGLKAGVNYTVTVTTLSEKPGLKSDPVIKSNYTKPTPPPWVTAIAHNETSITLTWGVPKESEGASNITYEVTQHSVYWNSTSSIRTKQNLTFDGLKSGTTYNFSVSVVADTMSVPKFAHYQTKPYKKTLTFVMLCSSKGALLCSNGQTQKETLNKDQ